MRLHKTALIPAVLLTSCGTPAPVELSALDELPVATTGRHSLPVRLSSRVVLTDIRGAKEYMESQKVTLKYLLDGERRRFTARSKGETDEQFTYQGMIYRPQNPDREGPIRSELVFHTSGGTEIVVRGNTVSEGWVYIKVPQR